MARSLRVILALLVLSSPALAQDRKRVAVLDFDYGTVRSVVQAYFGTDQDVGRGISILLEQKLVEDGKYRVIDRTALEKILKEQDFSNSDRADASTAAKIGRILGVNALIVGTITQFGGENKSVGVGGGGFGGGRFGLGGDRHEILQGHRQGHGQAGRRQYRRDPGRRHGQRGVEAQRVLDRRPRRRWRQRGRRRREHGQ